jgi:hypothetical protein
MTPCYVVRAGYEPSAQVSPSGLKLARMCERAWGYRYILGYKEPELPWSAFLPGGSHAVRPTKLEELKAWNRLRRPALGKEIHSRLEDWYAQRVVDWHDEPGKILLPALLHMPSAKTCAVVTEEKIPDTFVAEVTQGKHNYEFNAFIDVNGLDHEPMKLRVNDLKTTSGFQWALKPDELLTDTQGVVYPLYVMKKYSFMHLVPHMISVDARWVYTLTEGQPAARAVDFRVTYDGAMRRALPLFDEGATLVQKINDRADPNSLTPNVAACDMYHRKCIYHHSVGGPCKAESSPGKMARAFMARGPKQERTIMAFKKNLAAAVEGAEQPAADEQPVVEQGEGAIEESAEQKAEKRAYTKKAKSPSAARSIGGMSVTFSDGNVLEVPENSPVAVRLTAIHSALYGE